MIAALRAGANPNACSRNAPVLYVAAVLGREDLVNAHLNSGADVDARHSGDDSTALMAVAALGIHEQHTRILRGLQGRGADVNARERDGLTALDCAVGTGNLRNAELLLSAGATGKRSTLVELARLKSEGKGTGDRTI